MTLIFTLLIIASVLALGVAIYQQLQGSQQQIINRTNNIEKTLDALPDNPHIGRKKLPSLTAENIAIPRYRNFITTFGSAVIGQEKLAIYLLIGFLTNQHLLIEGVPGLAKTRSITVCGKLIGGKKQGLKTQRIQCTPDMMPSDIIGAEIFDRKTNEFVIKRGPLTQANLVLIDEINRTTPKVQSALLEAMQERQITIAGTTKRLPSPFLVFATQNPLDQAGTYPLPEAQRDRFLAQLLITYPTFADEIAVLDVTDSLETIQPLISLDDIDHDREAIARIHIPDEIKTYIVSIVHATRNHEALDCGASPRASRALLQTAQTICYLRGGHEVLQEDVVCCALDILRHRVIWHDYRLSQDQKEKILTDIISSVSLIV
ncbi:MAG: MoxR family ATPase [Candidatus Absconditabacterales bacterium]|nr:MoxR family ATPase [Candidatus Absconditabacterales bacterium]